MNVIERYFGIDGRNTTIKTEILAGLTTFLTMAYIIFVNPDMLAKAGMDKGAVFVATCLASALGCFLMGLIARLPVALAPLDFSIVDTRLSNGKGASPTSTLAMVS